MNLAAFAVLLGVFQAVALRDDPEVTGFVHSEVKMGVQFRISLYCEDRATAERAFAAAFAELTRLENVFSDYDPESETRWIDSQPAGQLIKISSDMQLLLHRSLELHQLTEGYFDVALGTLTKLWRESRRSGQVPTPEASEVAAANCGSHHLELRDQESVKKRLAGVELDFGGIAKGYAADGVLRLLNERFGITRVLVDASGDLVAGDAPPGQPGWIVGLSRPDGQQGLLTRIYLKNEALASSGDSKQFMQVAQQRWSHLLDPHEKTPIIGQNLTLVLAEDGTTADALASALAVCPAETFRRIEANFPEIAAVRYQRRAAEAEIQVIETAGWKNEVQKRLVQHTEK